MTQLDWGAFTEPESTVEISDWYSLLTFDGEPVSRVTSTWGGPCGTEEDEALRASAMAQGEKAGAGKQQKAITV